MGIAGYRRSFDKFDEIFLPTVNKKRAKYVQNYHKSVYVEGNKEDDPW